MSTQDTTLPPLPEQEREKFEAWADPCEYNLDQYLSLGQPYVDSDTEAAWQAWQARAAIAAQAQPPGFSPMWFAPIDGTPVMLYMPTTTNKFAVGQWHGSHDSIIGNWGDDEGNYFTHTPVSFMALSNLERIANPQATAEDSSVHQQAQQAQGVPAGMVQAVKDAIEGECDGLSINDARAQRILGYVLAAAPQAEPQAPAVGAARDSDKRLMEFYSVESVPALIDAQEAHIVRLQAKLPTINQPAFTRVREG